MIGAQIIFICIPIHIFIAFVLRWIIIALSKSEKHLMAKWFEWLVIIFVVMVGFRVAKKMLFEKW